MMYLSNDEANDTLSEEEKNDEPKRRAQVNNRRLHKCMTCCKVFPSKAHLGEHEVSHSDKQPYRCLACDRGFKRKNALSKHMRVFHPEGSSNVYCSCGKVYASQELMEKHKELSGSHRLYVCPECGALYRTEVSLKSHMMLHSESKESASSSSWPFTCQSCGEKLSSQASLSNHILNSHSTNDYHCQHCNKVCKTKQLLSQHCLRKHKTGNKEYSCPVCNKVFHIPKDLRRHMQSHDPEGLHECPVCHTKFKSYSTLQSHMKIHSKGKPYDCVICLLPCAAIENLRSHLFLHHSIDVVENDFAQNWNRKCPICGQIFLRRSSLAVHVKSHIDIDDAELFFVENTNVDTIIGSTSKKSEQCQMPHVKILPKVDVNKDKHSMREKICAVQVEEKSDRSINEVQFSHGNHRENVKEIFSNDRILVPCVSSADDCDVKNLSHDAKAQQLSLMDTNKLVITSKRNEETLIKVIKNDSIVKDKSLNENEISHTVKTCASNEDEETKYICGECSLVFTDIDDLRAHLLTCYQQDTNDEYVVVFEVDENTRK